MNELLFDGIDYRSGAYLAQVSTTIKLKGVVRDGLGALISRFLPEPRQPSGLKAGIDPNKPEEAGWGVIFAEKDHHSIPQAKIREALNRLLTHRQIQAKARYKEYSGRNGYRTDESALEFVQRHHAEPGPVDPDLVPYYLLLVGDPESIPFNFQYQLDVQHAVGRIHFDTLEQYRHYANSVVAAETGARPLQARVAFFAARYDPFTRAACDHLVKPLARRVKDSNWQVDVITGDDAKKAKLAQLLGGGPRSPALLVTGTHGLYIPAGDPEQQKKEGALVCQHQPGRGAKPSEFLSGEDIADDVHLPPMITFHCACFGAGTPRLNDYPSATAVTGEKPIPSTLAESAFVAQLPKRLLGHPNGGALAVIGHVERAWTYSFKGPKADKRLEHFTATLQGIMKGNPVGSSMAFLNKRYADLFGRLSGALNRFKMGILVKPLNLATQWIATVDARGYTVVGDPAVRLPRTLI